MEIIVLIGRVLFAALFLGSGFSHLMQSKQMAGYAGSKGVPAPLAAVIGSGILMLFAFFAYVDRLGLTVTGPLFELR